MGRVVLTGTPGNLLVVTAAMLPADRDLRGSFFRYVDGRNRNLSQFDLRDIDILDSDMRAVTLPTGGKTDYMMSRRTNWRNAVIPDDLSSYNADLVVEAYRQLAPNNEVLSKVIARISADYKNSWQDSIHDVMVQLGVTKEEARTRYNNVVGSRYPRLRERLRQHVVSNLIKDTPPNTVKSASAYPLAVPQGETIDLSAFPNTGQLDRYQTALDLEAAYPEYKFWVGQLDPHPILVIYKRELIEGELPWGWWSGAWPS
jgi:hypothetical protein